MRRSGQSMAKAPRIGTRGYPSHSGSAAGHALRARSRREQGPDRQGTARPTGPGLRPERRAGGGSGAAATSCEELTHWKRL